ncbi:hypothetical protein FJY63_08550 [Candidatus Sumerlaeota bacterium]|nr:hypothetical protein [Candidatus Sumerlaeota bacterium]
MQALKESVNLPQRRLRPFHAWLGEIAAAERDHGWLSQCEEAGQFLLLSREMVGSLAEFLRALGNGTVLEVCAGRGELAEALSEAGVQIVATDVDARPVSSVMRMSAPEALERIRPKVVLGCFVPFDSGVDAGVMSCPSVRHYIVLNARVGGQCGSEALWRNAAWTASPLQEISRWMITRHDVWTGAPEQPILQRGEAWQFSRNDRHG